MNLTTDGAGIRKLARFNYERNQETGIILEQQLAFTAPSSALTGLEYQFDVGKGGEKYLIITDSLLSGQENITL